jgi:uncharacterized protein YidB (DUF937 family)
MGQCRTTEGKRSYADARGRCDEHPGKLGGLLASTGLGDMLGNGLRDLVDSFKQAGHGEGTDSWVGHGPNKQIESSHLERIIGSDMLDTLVQQTGLLREEILLRIPTKPAMHSNVKPATCSDPKPAGVPI